MSIHAGISRDSCVKFGAKLGQGSFGQVFAAEHRREEGIVMAVKTITDSSDAAKMKKLSAEVNSLHTARGCPHIVQLYGLCLGEGQGSSG